MLIHERSNVAIQSPHFKKGPLDRGKVWGLMIHTTGSGIVEQALKHNADVLDWCVSYYMKPESYSPGYVIGYDGTIVQISSDLDITYHCGLASADRKILLSRDWRNKLAKPFVESWDNWWGPNYTAPGQLYPSKSPNSDYIGVEVPPLPAGERPTDWTANTRYTLAQHDACVKLFHDIAARHSIPKYSKGRFDRRRLLGHEDVNPITRSNSKGGWDPGHHRKEPWFDFDYVLAQVE